MDTDNSQTISLKELKATMARCNTYPSDRQIKKIMKEFDINHDG